MKTKILFINTEMSPYLPDTNTTLNTRRLAELMNNMGHEVRIFMPKWGLVNERKNQLHEVIRLSGMNLILNEADHPLLIKVAALPQTRMQVYFIDNYDYFSRKALYGTAKETYKDNAERMAFFARGVIETVRKLKWHPDVVYCQGWFAAVAPVYIKKVWNDDPSFKKVKVVFAYFNNGFKGLMPDGFQQTVRRDGISKSDLKECKDKITDCTAVQRMAVKHSDGLIISDQTAEAIELREFAEKLGKPVLQASSDDWEAEWYDNFFEKFNPKKETETIDEDSDLE